MARQSLTKTTSPSPNPTAGVAVTETAADTTNKEEFTLTGKELILVHNTGAGSHTYTINSVADSEFARTGDITAQSIAAGALHVLGPFGLDGWQQTDRTLHLEANDAEVKFAVITIP